ncbi:MAG: hypothetical protein KatS3mg095_0006 [Candidatus Parcubacteria bacterium]|nr:MAG: hypothetical protein KatS3mg095_0006 [Candidatus Parcubacteria bacterium]
MVKNSTVFKIIVLLFFIVFSFILSFHRAEASFKKFYVKKVLDSEDKIIVEDEYGDQYLVEYGLGCLSMWRYEGEYIYIDVGGAFLDGIGDRIYLLDSDQDCRVWDVEELDNNQSSLLYLYYLNLLKTKENNAPSITCPENSSYINGKCICNEGYVAINNKCLTYTQLCQLAHGPFSYGDKDYCYCYEGYEFKTIGTSTICAPIVCPSNSIKVGNKCVCKDGYVFKNGKCITYTEDCKLAFGSNVIGAKGPNNNSLCWCKKGYVWNKDATLCVKIKK